jgi:hypothetical protein
MDAVLVAMFAPTDGFQFMLEHPRTRVAAALEVEVNKLTGESTQGWILGQFRREMGAPWNTNSSQSAVDFFHALMDMCGFMELGTQTLSTIHVPRDPQKPNEIGTVRGDTFRVHTVIAGYHKSLHDALLHTEHPGTSSKYTSIVTSIQLDDPDMLVFEVGRNDSTAPMHYGSTNRGECSTMTLGDKTYVLGGVVCRTGAHYVAYMWMHDWFFYDDMMDSGEMVRCEHPETRRITPSRYGELFFYQLK